MKAVGFETIVKNDGQIPLPADLAGDTLPPSMPSPTRSPCFGQQWSEIRSIINYGSSREDHPTRGRPRGVQT